MFKKYRKNKILYFFDGNKFEYHSLNKSIDSNFSKSRVRRITAR